MGLNDLNRFELELTWHCYWQRPTMELMCTSVDKQRAMIHRNNMT